MRFKSENELVQSQKTQVADFGTVSDERISRSKIVLLFNGDKRTLFRKFEGLTRSKILGILQTFVSKGENFSRKLKN